MKYILRFAILIFILHMLVYLASFLPIGVQLSLGWIQALLFIATWVCLIVGLFNHTMLKSAHPLYQWSPSARLGGTWKLPPFWGKLALAGLVLCVVVNIALATSLSADGVPESSGIPRIVSHGEVIRNLTEDEYWLVLGNWARTYTVGSACFTLISIIMLYESNQELERILVLEKSLATSEPIPAKAVDAIGCKDPPEI